MPLSVSDLVKVTVNLAPTAAAVRAFGILMVAGDSNVIDGVQRFRTYTSVEGVTADFGTDAPESEAAELYFGQIPQPQTLMVGRWLRIATAGFNNGGILTASQQLLSNWTSITTGSFKVTIDGVLKTLTGLDFHLAANLNAVAADITTALSGAGTCVWNGQNFEVISATTGTSSTVSAAIAAGSGFDISAQLKLTASTLQALIPGFAAESALACVQALADASPNWYGLNFAASVFPSDDDCVAIAGFIEALDITRVYGVTITDTNVLSSEVTDDLASRLMAGAYLQTCCQYSSSSAYAISSLFGRAFTVDFTGQNTTITLMYKQEPAVVGEDLSEQEAQTLQAKRCNVFVDYENNTMIIQTGVMSGPAYFDEIHGLDWFQNALQTACFNVLYTSPTKIPQTDAGAQQLANACAGVCDQAVTNGLLAPGTWNGPSFGQLTTGQFLKTGYYIFTQPMALQSQSDRDARKAPPIQIAAKLAGAIQTASIVVDVNR